MNNFKKYSAFVKAAIAAVMFALVFTPVYADKQMTILYTNDTHSNLMPFDSKDYGQDVGGIARRAELVRRIREQAPYALFLDSGDMFQGTPFYPVFKGEACYMLAKAAGYEATTIGNHEADNGFDNLIEKAEMAGLRVLCCNIFDEKTHKTLFPGWHLFLRNGLKIAVIGSLSRDAFYDMDTNYCVGKQYKDQAEEIRKIAKRIRPYVDLIVVLSHGGLDNEKKLAAEVSEVDVILGAHTHDYLPKPLLIKNKDTNAAYNNGLKGTLLLQDGWAGTHLGYLELTLSDEKQIKNYDGSLILVTSEFEPSPDDPVKLMADKYYDKLNKTMSEVIGHSEKGLPFPKSLKRTHILPLGTFTAKTMNAASKADLSIVNSGSIRAEIEAGDVTCGDVYKAIPYDNTIVLCEMTGKALQKMFDYMAANYYKLEGFQMCGITGDFNIKTGKAENLEINGQPIDLDKTYFMGTSSFISNGNLGGKTLLAEAKSLKDTGIVMRDAAINYIRKVQDIPDFSKAPITIIGADK